MLPYCRIFTLVVVLVLSWQDVVSARSSPPKPLARVAYPSTLAIEILPRHRRFADHKRSPPPLQSTTLHHSDSFRLTLSAFGETFYLHLRPNEHLIHPSARINYYSVDSNGQSVLTHTEALQRETVKAYWGEVIPAHASPLRMREDTAGVMPRPAGHSELGWARIMVHHQGDAAQGVPPIFEGAFSVNGVVHHVMTTDNYLRTKHALDPEVHALDNADSLVIWRDSDVVTTHGEEHTRQGDGAPLSPSAHSCGHDSLPYNTDPLRNPLLRPSSGSPWFDPYHFLDDPFSKRDDIIGNGAGTNFVSSIGNIAGCPKSQKVLYMGVAADCTYTLKNGGQQNATTKILTNWNTASSLYKSSFNVSLGIVELNIQNSTCPASPDPAIPWNVDCGGVDLNSRLSLFSDWRGRKGSDDAGLWHLMSGCPTGTEVGIAWLGTLCQQSSGGEAGSVVSGTAVSTTGRTEWQVVAHETGHNFGAIHDCADGCSSTSPCCPFTGDSCNANAQFLMSPVSSDGEVAFSPCSLGNICSMMTGVSGGKTNTSCLLDPDPNRATISLQMCGNGIVENGEDCDPGNGVESACCDSKTCKFRNGAVCDPQSSTCCTADCRFAPTTKTCRPSKDSQCDTAEMCTGNSSTCPPDVFAPNGQSCGPNSLACASGICTSVAKQCQDVGASLNLKNACPNRNDQSCQIACADPSTANRCIVLQSQLIDGSPCGYGGTCLKGKCQQGNALNTAKAWYLQNLQISIPVTVVAGIILIGLFFSLISCIRRSCARHRSVPTSEPSLGRIRGERLSSWAPPMDTAPTATPYNAAPFNLAPGPPAALLPGSNASYTRSPPHVHSTSSVARRQSGRTASTRRFDGTRAEPRMQFPTHPIRDTNRDHWVDASLYNGRPA